MPRPRYVIRFPQVEPHQLNQDEAFFYLDTEGDLQAIRFHDYAALYTYPGLYEQLYAERLKCASPHKVAHLLRQVVEGVGEEMPTLRVLDLGAGNGLMGEALTEIGVARLLGVDIVPEAFDACERDRPGLYDAYYVADLTALDEVIHAELRDWKLDCMVCVSALGFGDMPPAAFATGFNLVRDGGWIAFNIKETFLQRTDDSGFSRLVQHLMMNDLLQVHHLERYRHRYSIDGAPLYYHALVGRKVADVPTEVLATLEVDDGCAVPV